ncbi:MAG: hypothetical protein DRJ35_02150 [Thermoprotei archaeon]|nr:MAG: hypothetical protein DRJ35_02150 [Thermoprotei archaeon]
MRLTADKIAELVIIILELLVAMILICVILLSLSRIIIDVLSMTTLHSFDKEYFVRVLDEALLMVVAIDIIRTLLTGILKKRITVVVVIEAALIFIIREIIALELKLIPETRLIIYGILFLIFFLSWYILRRSMLEEKMLKKVG